jgi:hypothetical protein
LEAEPCDLDWPELRELWGESDVFRPICFAPPDEKLDLFFAYACQAAGLPISLGTVFNPGWTEMFLSTLQHDALVLTEDLVQYLVERRLFASHIEQLKLLVVVGDPPEEMQRALEAFTVECRLAVLPHPARALAT